MSEETRHWLVAVVSVLLATVAVVGSSNRRPFADSFLLPAVQPLHLMLVFRRRYLMKTILIHGCLSGHQPSSFLPRLDRKRVRPSLVALPLEHSTYFVYFFGIKPAAECAGAALGCWRMVLALVGWSGGQLRGRFLQISPAPPNHDCVGMSIPFVYARAPLGEFASSRVPGSHSHHICRHRHVEETEGSDGSCRGRCRGCPPYCR